MLRPVDHWFLEQEEPAKSCLAFLRDYILKINNHITESWKYSMPFYNYKGKRFCYLWMHKKYHQPYIGIVDGNSIEDKDLLQENRKRMRIFLVDPSKDVPIQKVEKILNKVIALYQ
jgi:hypothetical protein